MDRYLTAFENGPMDDAICAPSIANLEAKIIQLNAHRAELTELINAEPQAATSDVIEPCAVASATSSSSAIVGRGR